MGKFGKIKADAVGHYAFEIHNHAHFRINAERPEYEPSGVDYNLQNIEGRDSLANEHICLKALVYPEKEIDKLLKALERSSHVGNFAYKKTILSDSAHDNLDTLVIILKKFPEMVIEVEGYTDGIGSEKYNLALSWRRVYACIRYLLRKRVSANQVAGKSMGKFCPIAPEKSNGMDNPAGREMN